MNNEMEIEQQLLKNRVLSANNTFKTAFTATLGFYAAQLTISLLTVATIGVVITVVAFVYKLTQ